MDVKDALRRLDVKPDKGRISPATSRPSPKVWGRALEPYILGYVEKFMTFRPGESFFIEDIKPSDIEFLRRPILSAGLGIAIRRMDCDPIYKKAGVRVWRQVGPFDNL